MKIITFGSCMSRYTANHFCRIFGGKIVSSVYHNRSDAFVGKFIEKTWIHYPEIEIKQLLNKQGLQVLKNQYEKTVGMHHLKNGLQFFNAISSAQGDLIILDNFIGISARLFCKNSSNKEGIFLRPHDFLDRDHQLVLSDHLPINCSIASFNNLILFIRTRLPAAMIVFINFPTTTYAEFPEKVARLKDFEKKLFIDDSLIIPALDVSNTNHTAVKSHFKPVQYTIYARIVHEYVRTKRAEHLLSKWQRLKNITTRFFP